MATYCTLLDVASEWPLTRSFTATGHPSAERVSRYIEEAANDIETAALSGNHYTLPFPMDKPAIPPDPNVPGDTGTPAVSSAAAQWLRETNVQGTLYRLGQFLYSYGRGGNADRVPWQEEFPMRLKMLREGSVQWGDKNVEPSTKQIPSLRQRFC